MTPHHILLIIHLLAATIWVGGHLLLVTSYVPQAIRTRDKSIILHFEERYERLGMISLIILVSTGIAMAFNYGVYPSQWFHFDTAVENVVSIKLTLLFATLFLAMSARFYAIPRLKSELSSMTPMIIHIILVTTIAILMVVAGSFIRFGGL